MHAQKQQQQQQQPRTKKGTKMFASIHKKKKRQVYAWEKKKMKRERERDKKKEETLRLWSCTAGPLHYKLNKNRKKEENEQLLNMNREQTKVTKLLLTCHDQIFFETCRGEAAALLDRLSVYHIILCLGKKKEKVLLQSILIIFFLFLSTLYACSSISCQLFYSVLLPLSSFFVALHFKNTNFESVRRI